MFQIMKRQILVNIREKSNIFWTLFFPLILATLFHFTLGGTMGRHAMEDVQAAFVTDQSADPQEEEAFLEYLKSFDGDWFQILSMSEEEAREALKNDEILGIFYGGEEKKLVIGEDSTYTSILSQTLDIYEKNEHMLAQIAEEHPENLPAAIEAVSDWGSYTETVTFQGDSLDSVQNYFFALIAMTCLYGSFMGMYNTVGVQANTSDLGARLAAGCVKRYKTITASLLSSWRGSANPPFLYGSDTGRYPYGRTDGRDPGDLFYRYHVFFRYGNGGRHHWNLEHKSEKRYYRGTDYGLFFCGGSDDQRSEGGRREICSCDKPA